MSARHLFLKGASGAGKTTFLLSEMAPYWKQAGGFLTQRLLNKDGETMGFCLKNVADLAAEGNPLAFSPVRRYEPGLSNLFLEWSPEGMKKHPQVFEDAGVKILNNVYRRREELRFCYLDEIGGIEMMSEPFIEALYRVLSSGVPCIGVVKNAGNLKAMKQRVEAEPGCMEGRNLLEERIKTEYRGQILSFTGALWEKEAVRNFIRTKGGEDHGA